MLLNIEKNEKVSQTDINNVRKFVIKFMYSDRVSCNLTQKRAEKWKHIKNKTTFRLLLDKDFFISICCVQTVKKRFGMILLLLPALQVP